MAETGRRPLDPHPGGPSPEALEARWSALLDEVSAAPCDAELLIKAGQLSDQLGRKLEAWTYFRRAYDLDPSKGFLVAKLRGLASTPQQKEEVAKLAARPATFAAALGDVFVYPWRGRGKGILGVGALILWLARAGAGSAFGLVALGVGGLLGAYLLMYYVDICSASATGEDEIPDWPDPLRLTEFFVDWAKFAVAAVVSFLPILVVAGLFAADLLDPPSAGKLPLLAGGLLFLLAGLAYLPMATLANIIYGNPFACVNVPYVARSILRTGREYLVCLGAYFGTSVASGILETVVSITNTFNFGGFVVMAIQLYSMAVLMRILGIFYRMNQAKLGWMRD